METVSCNLCSSDDLEPVYQTPDATYGGSETFTVVRCAACGLGFVDPRPTYEEMARFYPPSFYEYFDREHDYHAKRYEVEARMVEQAAGRGGLLLDVGCANGDFPRFMKSRGWRVEGVEVSDSSRTIDDFTVWRQEFDQAPLPTAKYDAVTAWAVLEHVHDPMAYFAKAATVLKPGGALVFLVTNFSSLSSWALFREDVPRHLFFFTEPTVRRYLETVGLELVSSDYSDRVYAMRPVNWLRFMIEARLMRRPFTLKDATFSRATYLARRGWRQTPLTTALFVLTHPHFVLDRWLMRGYERFQMWRHAYGIATYVARKPAP